MNTTVQLPTSVTTGDIIQFRSGGKWETWQVVNDQGECANILRDYYDNPNGYYNVY